MSAWEFHVVPAPRRGVKTKGARTAEERFAVALAEVMNDLGAQGWDYVRTDILPCEERQGLTGKTTVYHSMMVFRRPLGAPAAADPVPPPAPQMQLPSPAAVPPVAPPVIVPGAADLAHAAPPLGPADRSRGD